MRGRRPWSGLLVLGWSAGLSPLTPVDCPVGAPFRDTALRCRESAGGDILAHRAGSPGTKEVEGPEGSV